MLLSDNVTIWF